MQPDTFAQLHQMETAAWREKRDRHRDWWTMPAHERQRVLSYESGFDDGYAQAVADIAAAWAGRSYYAVPVEQVAQVAS